LKVTVHENEGDGEGYKEYRKAEEAEHMRAANSEQNAQYKQNIFLTTRCCVAKEERFLAVSEV